MERTPIMIQSNVNVKLVQHPLSVKDVIPTYSYQLQGVNISQEASHMFQDFLDFLGTNEELIFQETSNQSEYIKGFQRAVSLLSLWVDSIYVTEEE